MRSRLPKSIHPVGGKPILARILQAVQQAGFGDIRTVTAEGMEKLLHPIARSFKAQPVVQTSKPGTAGAVMAVPLDELFPYCLIMNGDHPLISSQDLTHFFDQAVKADADLVIGACSISDPKNFGRILREGSQIKKIVEFYDFNEEIESINEINTGLMIVKTSLLKKNLPLITNDNPKKEYPLTDLVSLFYEQGLKVESVSVDIQTAFGVNTQEELALANTFCFEQKTKELMDQGVILPAPQQVYIEDDVTVGNGSIIYPGVYLKGQTQIGSFCAIEQNCFIFDCRIENSVSIKSHSHLEKAHVQSQSVIGPFARLRPGAVIGPGCKVGNFAEIKNSQLGEGAKASHQCYLGDSTIGKNVNIGAGAVICNYSPDKKKHKTTIKEDTFIGSGSLLIAPVEIGRHSIVGAGSVITQDVPDQTLAISRVKQQNKKNRQTLKKNSIN